MDLSSLLMIHSNSFWVKTCIRIKKLSHIVILYVYIVLHVYASKFQVKEKKDVYFARFPRVPKIFFYFFISAFLEGN